MYQPISLFIGLRYFWNFHIPQFKKVVAILSILSISLGISAIIIVLAIMNGFEKKFKENILYFIPHAIITNSDKKVNSIEFPKEILKIDNIQKISNFVNKEVVIQSKKNIAMGEILGIDAKNYTDIKKYHIYHILHKLPNGKNNAIIGNQLAHQLDLKIGDSIRLMSCDSIDKNIKNSFLKDNLFFINGIFYSNNEVDSYQLLINQNDALRFLGYSEKHLTGWRIWFKNPLSMNLNTIKKFIPNFTILDWTKQKNILFKSITIERYIAMILLILLMIVSIFNIIMNLILNITDKKNSVAILKLQGLCDGKITLIFFILHFTTVLMGLLIGLFTGIILVIQKNILLFCINLFFHHIKITMIINFMQIFYISIIFIFLTTCLTFYPSWNASKCKISSILSHE